MSTDLRRPGIPGIAGTLDRTLTVATEDVIARWLEYERLGGASDNTLAAYRKGVGVFVDWLRSTASGAVQGQALDVADLAESDPGPDLGGQALVTPRMIRQFKGDLAETYSPQTVNLRLAALRSFYRYCVNTDRLATNPAAEVKGMKRPKSKTHKRDALTNGEVLAVLATCDVGTLAGIRDRAILSLMAYCALREVEVHRANVGHLKTQGERLVLEVQGKGRLEADEVVVIPPHEGPVIRAWLAHRLTFPGMPGRRAQHGDDDPLFVSLARPTRGQRLALRSIRAIVKDRYRAAGVVGSRKTTHSLRHSAITNAIRQGAAPLQVQAMARHTSFDTTLGYYHEVGRLDNPAEDLIDYGT